MTTRDTSRSVAAGAESRKPPPPASSLPSLGGNLGALQQFLVDVARHTEPSPSPHTIRARASDWKDFSDWCDRNGLAAIPAQPATVALYLTSLARDGLKLATINRRSTTITHFHRVSGHEPPTRDPEVRQVLTGLAVALKSDSTQKAPLSRSELMLMLERMQSDQPLDRMIRTAAHPIAVLRDKALLLTGFALALHRSELVAIRVEDLAPTPEGYVVHLRTSAEQGNEIDALTLYRTAWNKPCPVRALNHWFVVSGITSGPVFRQINRHGTILPEGLTPQSVALIIKKWASAAGLDASQLSGHSLRSGFATQAAQDGHHPVDIADVTRHRDRSILNGYLRTGRSDRGVPRVL